MRNWIRLGLAAVVIIAALLGVWGLGKQAILISDVQAVKHGDKTLHVLMRIRNDGEPDRLVSAASGYAEAVLVSADAEELPIPANSEVSLSSDGAFIALKDIRGGVEEGRLVPVQLIFKTAGTITAKARINKPMMMHGAMGHGKMGMAYNVPESEQSPSLSITAAPVADGSWTVTLETENFTFSQDAVDGPHQPGTGHAHLYVGGVKLGRVFQSSATVPPLPAGDHIIRVTLNTNNHKAYRVGGKPVTATLKITALSPNG